MDSKLKTVTILVRVTSLGETIFGRVFWGNSFYDNNDLLHKHLSPFTIIFLGGTIFFGCIFFVLRLSGIFLLFFFHCVVCLGKIMQRKLVISATILAMATIMQLWFMGTVFEHAVVCDSYFNTTLECQADLPLYYCTCTTRDDTVVRNFDVAAFAMTMLAALPLICFEIFRTVVIVQSICEDDHYLVVDSFSILGVLAMLFRPQFIGEYKNRGSFVWITDIVFLFAIFRYSVVTQFTDVWMVFPVAATISNLGRAIVLNVLAKHEEQPRLLFSPVC